MLDLDKLRTNKLLGVGCSTFGGSTPPQAARATLARAYEQGVVYFDVARSYGYGQAEALVGQFARDKRSQVIIASKCGIVPPPIPLRSLVLWSVRHLRKALPTSGRTLTKAGNQSLKRATVTPQFVEQSLHASLRELKTDYLDIFLLHESCHSECARDDLRAALEKVKAQGKIRTWGATLADRECLQQQLDSAAPVAAVQFPFGLDAAYHAALESEPSIRIIYSVLNYYKSLALTGHSTLFAALKADFPGLAFLDTFPELCLYFAFTQLPAGVVLSSMTSPANLNRNIFLFNKSLGASAQEMRAAQQRLTLWVETESALGPADAVR